MQSREYEQAPVMGQMLLDCQKHKPRPSAARQEMKAWLSTRRRIQRDYHTFWMDCSRQLDQAKLDLCEEVNVMHEDFEPHILDFLKYGWVDGILEWKKDRDEEQKAAEEEAELWRLEQDRAAGSQAAGGHYSSLWLKTRGFYETQRKHLCARRPP